MKFDQMEDIKVWTWIEIKCWNNEPDDIPEEPEELEEEEAVVAEDGEQPAEEEKTPDDVESELLDDPDQQEIKDFLKQLQIDRANGKEDNNAIVEDTVSEQRRKIQGLMGQAMLAKLKKPKPGPTPSEGSKGQGSQKGSK